jgi:hypothetical protein
MIREIGRRLKSQVGSKFLKLDEKFSEYKSHDDELLISCPKKHKYLALNEVKLDRTCPRTELSTFCDSSSGLTPDLLIALSIFRGTNPSLISGS